MLDLKAKLLAAGLVTADQVKKVEDEEAQRKQRAKEAREARKHGHKPQERRGDGPRNRGPQGDKRREARPDPNDPHEKEARREHQLVEAERWRKRLAELAAAGKAEQYEAIRGWVLRHRLDSKNISEVAERFHFTKMDGSLSHLTVEPDVREQLSAGAAAVVAFMGFNGLEHAAIPKDVALDVQQVKPEWLRALAGVTDVNPPEVAVAEAAQGAEAPAADASAVDASSTPADGEPVSGT